MTTTNVLQIIDRVIDAEKGYVDHPDDLGGPTNWGVTEKEARANGYTGDMRDLPREFAERLFFRKYFVNPGFDKVAVMSHKLAYELTDTGVNQGVGTASMFLQRSLNAFNLKATIYPDLKVDGQIGPVTLSALASYLRKRTEDGEEVLLKALNCLQGARYIELCEARERNETFVYGWIRARVQLADY